mgnify:CR=1 FL=1
MTCIEQVGTCLYTIVLSEWVRLNIKVPNIFSIVADEVPTRSNLFAHKAAEDNICGGCVLDIDAKQGPSFGIN